MVGRELSLRAVTSSPRSDGVLAVDLAGKVTYVNRTTELMTGQARGDLLGHPLGFLLNVASGTVPQRLAVVMGRTSAHDHRAKAPDAWFLDRRESLWIPIEFSAQPIRCRNGIIAGAMIVFREVD